MKRTLLLMLFTLFGGLAFAQNYNNPGGTINDCNGNFNDTGGTGSNYTNSQDITTTICSDAGNCVSVNFTSFNIENGWDFLYIYDGPTTGSTLIGTYTGTTSPGTISSSTGCLTFRFTSDGSVTRPGWSAAISCGPCPAVADYTHPTAGINGEFVGACLVTDCGPFTYADDGGFTGNYANGTNLIYRTFCPDQAGMCMRATFNSFETFDSRDFLAVKNGPTQNSPDFTAAPIGTSFYGLPFVGLFGDLNGITPFNFTSTDSSGCLTFRFYSSGVNNDPGWDATLECVPCAVGPTGTENTDCTNATAICSSNSFAGNSTGPGLSAEGCTGASCPAGGENHSNWYTFTVNTSGTFTFTITPNDPTDDYDYNLHGPAASCGAIGPPIRCSDSGTAGTTGLNFTATDTQEDVTGDSFTQFVNVTAGETYYLVIDKWSPAAASGYTLSFGGTANLDCSVLPVELSKFDTEYRPEDDAVDITWTTDSERNCDFYDVERSTDGINFEVIHTVKGGGTTNNQRNYFVNDPNPAVGVNYYRLNQWDTDGNGHYSELRSVNILDDVYDMLSLSPNPTTGKTNVIFNSYSKGEAFLKVISTDGRTIVHMPIAVNSGGNSFSLDMTGQDKGVYLISITTRDKTYVTKLMKD